MKPSRILRIAYQLLIPLISRYTRWRFNVHTEPFQMPEGPALILANHTTGYDQFMVTDAIQNRYSYFVCAENITQNRLLRWLLIDFCQEIVHVKGKQGIQTIKEMLKRLKAGYHVVIFPEGNRSFDGRTMHNMDAIGGVVKLSAANLVLLRMEGGYFSQPRWATTFRKGEVRIIPKVYTAEQIAGMSKEEINKLILAHLHVDAYEDQQKNPISYQGKHLCLGIESSIYQCPGCGKIGTLRSNDWQMFCTCGYHATFDSYGYLTDTAGNKQTVSTHLDAQKEALKSKVLSVGSVLLFEDTVKLYAVDDASHNRHNLGTTKLLVYTDKVEVVFPDMTTQSISLKEITSVVIFGRNTMNVCLQNDNRRFEIKGDISFSALKYRDLFDLIHT